MMQGIWENCCAEIFYTNGSYAVEKNFEVRMTGEALEVYTLGGPKNLVGFKGAVHGHTGHYRLQGIFGGSATLHLCTESSLLEGSWEEHGLEGMWRISLVSTAPGKVEANS